jgi:hypothetical protein
VSGLEIFGGLWMLFCRWLGIRGAKPELSETSGLREECEQPEQPPYKGERKEKEPQELDDERIAGRLVND